MPLGALCWLVQQLVVEASAVAGTLDVPRDRGRWQRDELVVAQRERLVDARALDAQLPGLLVDERCGGVVADEEVRRRDQVLVAREGLDAHFSVRAEWHESVRRQRLAN